MELHSTTDDLDYNEYESYWYQKEPLLSKINL